MSKNPQFLCHFGKQGNSQGSFLCLQFVCLSHFNVLEQATLVFHRTLFLLVEKLLVFYNHTSLRIKSKKKFCVWYYHDTTSAFAHMIIIHVFKRKWHTKVCMQACAFVYVHFGCVLILSLKELLEIHTKLSHTGK